MFDTKEQIIAAILAANFTSEDISDIYNALTFKRSKLNVRISRQLSVGQTVSFMGRKHLRHTGKIIKINPKNVKVSVFEGERTITWTCSPSALTVVE